MESDPLILSRIQFAFVISFHILFPAFTIGLASYLALLEGLWLTTRREGYLRLARFWTKIFAVSFGMGVVSGVVMSYQFGTNWGRFADLTSNVVGPLLSYEVLTAFFLEAGFLGILLFGRGRVHPWLTFLAAVMVALGTLVSSFWILSANSWMQTPAGFEIRGGRFFVTDWWQAIFNPSFPYRLSHMVTASYLTTAFVVIGVGAWYSLKGRHTRLARSMLSMTLWLATILAPLQIFLGDLHGLNTLEYQPAKVAAMEGHWESRQGAPMILFALPDQAEQTNHFELGIPKLGSLILKHDWNAPVRGLKEWPRDQQPYVPAVFFSFRVMVGIGFAMLALIAWSLFLRYRGRLFENRLFLRACVVASPLGFLAVLAGWFTTELGRQPWLVYGQMRVAKGVSVGLPAGSVWASLALYALAYAIIFGSGLWFIFKLVRVGPQPPDHDKHALRDVPEPPIDKRIFGS
jgi:cytochrome d ubiquinol oxidase subunit I